MPVIVSYKVEHQIGTDGTTPTTTIQLKSEAGMVYELEGLGNEDAGYLLDLLRNEGPLIYEPVTKLLVAGSWEPVGEGE